MADLKTTYQDDVLDTSVNEKRKYNMIQNADGTVSFEDVTTYSQVGDSFGAADINATNEMLEKVNSNLKNENNETFNFGVKDGVRGFFTDPSRADDCFIPFKKTPTASYVVTFTGTGGDNAGTWYKFDANNTLISQTVISFNVHDIICDNAIQCVINSAYYITVNALKDCIINGKEYKANETIIPSTYYGYLPNYPMGVLVY